MSRAQVCALLASLEEDGIAELLGASQMLGDDPRRSSTDAQANFVGAMVYLESVAHLHALLCADAPTS